MSDRELAQALMTAIEVERLARAHTDASEQDQARAVLRHTIALKGSLERWISTRAMKTQLSSTG